MSVLTAVEAGLGKVGHAFVVGAAKLKAVVVGAAKAIAGAESEIHKLEELANGVVAEIYPGAEKVALAIEAAMDKVFAAVEASGAAADANGLNVQLDIATVTAIKAALPIVKAQAATTPGS